MNTKKRGGKNHQAQVVPQAVNPQAVHLLKAVPVKNLLTKTAIKKKDRFIKTKNKE